MIKYFEVQKKIESKNSFELQTQNTNSESR